MNFDLEYSFKFKKASSHAIKLAPSFWAFSVITEGFICSKKYPAAMGTVVVRLPAEKALEKPCRVERL